MKNQTILTGIRVNGEMTLGNFLGALLPMVRLANQYSDSNHINIFVPDLHTIVAKVEGDLCENVINSVKYYLAAGLQLNKNIHIYRQSYIPAHSELTWILDCFAYTGEMRRMIQYKEKSDGDKDSTNVGIFNYPVLQAADILLYSAKYVPVGEDQFQHIELTRNIAERFNRKFVSDIFTIPATTVEQAKFMSLNEGLRIRDLVNPEKKMSKSSPNEKGKVMLDDDPEIAGKKIMSATTDSVGLVQFDMFNQPGISNLLQILALLRDQPLAEVVGAYAGNTQYGDLKTDVATAVRQFLADFQARVAEISDEKVFETLQRGESEMQEVANAKLLEVQKAVGLR